MNPTFKIYTGLLKAFDGPDGEKRFRTTASSTITDLAGDEILAPAIEKMATKAQGNLTIFLNHEYRVPEDVLGSVESAAMQTRGVDSEGNPIVDLDFDIRLNQANPRALQTWEAIKAGTKLGTSIGAIVRHAEKKKGGGLKIDDLELLEASIVGIPANPRSWVQYAVKSINATAEMPETSFVIDEESVIEKEADGDETVEKTVELDEMAAATCKGCGHAAGCDCTDCSCKKEIEPDKETTTQVTVTVEVESAQEAPKSIPEFVLTDEDRADVPVDTDEEIIDPLTISADAPDKVTDVADLATIVTKFQEITAKYMALQEENVTLKAERDESNENLVAAKEIIDRIADLPIGRKTQFAGPMNDFRKKFGGTYDDEFIKFLEK